MCQQPTYYVYATAILFFELNGQTNVIEVKITQKTESVIHLIVYITYSHSFCNSTTTIYLLYAAGLCTRAE